MGRLVEKLLTLITQYSLDQHNDDWRDIKFMAEHGLLKDRDCEILFYEIDEAIQNQIDYPDYLHRPPDPDQFYAEGKPHIRLGTLANDKNMVFGPRFDGPFFLLVSGLTGYGKTTAIRVLLHRIEQYNLLNPDKKIVVYVFDRKGGDYADLPAILGWKHFHVYNSLRQALEPPEGMAPQTWINIVANIFCSRTGLKYSWVTFVDALRTLLGILNPKPSQRLIWPDFRLILDFINAFPATMFSSKPEYTRSLTTMLSAVSRSSFKTFNAFQGFRVEDLIKKQQSAVIAMPNMEPSWMRQLFVDLIISTVVKGRIERSEHHDHVRVLFVVEEADPDVDAGSELLFSDKMSPISECFKRARAFGVGTVIIVSSLLRVSELVRENATMHMMFRMQDSFAVREAARTLMLPPNAELIFGHLGKGECVVKQAGPWPHAVRAIVDHVPPSHKHVTEYDRHDYIPSQRLWQLPPEVQEAVKRLKETVSKNKKETPEEKNAERDRYAMKLLRLRARNPYAPVARLFDAIGNIRFEAQVAIRKMLEDNGYAEFEEVRIGRSNMLLMDVTDKGYKAVNLPVPVENKGRGSISHRHFAHWIKIFYEKLGRKAFVEWIVPGTNHPVDTAVVAGNKWEVFEVCVTASDNVISHIKACFEDGSDVERLTIVVATKTKLKELKKHIQSDFMFTLHADKVDFDVIQNFVIKELENYESD